ncbi:MAG: hypothetical protein CL609_17065 [Anaerolineaceae bacterium]|nr:hypothetical protein [Anaerolineaceae bacterium]
MTEKKYADRIFGVQHLPQERQKKAAWAAQGIKHRSMREIKSDLSGYQLQLKVTTQFDIPVNEVCCWVKTENDLFPVCADLINVEWSELNWQYVQHWTVTLSIAENIKTVNYWLAAKDPQQKQWIFADNQASSRMEATCFALVLPEPVVPDWAKQAIIYQVFVDRFSPGKNKVWKQTSDVFGLCGGTLNGVLDHLDYIQGLGCNTIWLSPIFVSDSHHGYNAKDLFKIEPRFGTLSDFQNLVNSMHQRGMYLLLDFVANHWSDQHPSFLEAQSCKKSEFYDWYKWNCWPSDYECYFGVPDLPELNLQHGPARQHVLQAAAYWLQQGADGFRLDHAAGPPLDFWADFYQVCYETKPECWLFGEYPASATDQFALTQVLHPPLDFLLNRAIRETFGLETWSMGQFVSFLSDHLHYFSNHYGPVFLDNHDMNRFLFVCGNRVERLKQAAFLLFTLPHPPILYYGTEIGMSQPAPVHARPQDFGTFEMARFPMVWDQTTHDLQLFFKQLFSLRDRWKMLWGGNRQFEIVDSEHGFLLQKISKGADTVWLAVNRADTTQIITNKQFPSHHIPNEYWGDAVLTDDGWLLHPGGIAFWF